jgi:hypothetical protein
MDEKIKSGGDDKTQEMPKNTGSRLAAMRWGWRNTVQQQVFIKL